MELLSIKEKLIEVTKSIDSETTIDDVMENIFSLNKVEKGLQQVSDGKVISHFDLKKQVSEWKQ